MGLRIGTERITNLERAALAADGRRNVLSHSGRRKGGLFTSSIIYSDRLQQPL
jgi:hypothetical protein